MRWIAARKPPVRAPNTRSARSRPEHLSARARDELRGWVERHVVADDPYADVDLQRVDTEERTPLWTGAALALMVLSGIISITGLIILWRWLAG